MYYIHCIDDTIQMNYFFLCNISILYHLSIIFFILIAKKYDSAVAVLILTFRTAQRLEKRKHHSRTYRFTNAVQLLEKRIKACTI